MRCESNRGNVSRKRSSDVNSGNQGIKRIPGTANKIPVHFRAQL